MIYLTPLNDKTEVLYSIALCWGNPTPAQTWFSCEASITGCLAIR
jgi:hypothetical protein